MTVTVELQGSILFGEGCCWEGADPARLLDQCGENPVARLQPTTGVMSQICKRRGRPGDAAPVTCPQEALLALRTDSGYTLKGANVTHALLPLQNLLEIYTATKQRGQLKCEKSL